MANMNWSPKQTPQQAYAVETAEFIKNKIKFQRGCVNRDLWQCCLNCQYWNGSCKKFNSIPPPDVIVYGCENHEFSIPF